MKPANLMALSAGKCVLRFNFDNNFLNKAIDCTEIHFMNILFTIIYEENNHLKI